MRGGRRDQARNLLRRIRKTKKKKKKKKKKKIKEEDGYEGKRDPLLGKKRCNC